jgi:predicted MFS family arabinose efflux permease
VAGIAAATPLGRLADRLGPREVLIVLSVVRGASMAGFLFAGDLFAITGVASLVSATQQGTSAGRTALIAGLTAPEERLDALSSLRVLSHAGDALGAAAGALVIQLDTRAAYVALIGGTRSPTSSTRGPRRSSPASPCACSAPSTALRCTTATTSRSPRSAAC